MGLFRVGFVTNAGLKGSLFGALSHFLRMEALHNLINAMILLDIVVSGSSSDVSPVAGGLMYLPSESFRAVDVALTALLQGVEYAHTRAPTESICANLVDHRSSQDQSGSTQGGSPFT